MCRRFVMLEWDEVLQVLHRIETDAPLVTGEEWPVRGLDAYPGSEAPVIAAVGAKGGTGSPSRRAGVEQPHGLEPACLRWGFEAPWDARKLLFNTRIETALAPGGGLWGDALRNGRCIVPTLGFFESSETETVASPRTGKPMKTQYRFAAPEGLTLLAGVRNQDAFSVVTTEPNERVAPVHARMPLVLRESEARQWLFGDAAALADRTGVALDVSTEAPPASSGSEDAQLPLF